MSAEMPWRRTTQELMPARRRSTDAGGYELYPAHPLGDGCIDRGFDALVARLGGAGQVVVDGFPGVLWDALADGLAGAYARAGIDARLLDVAVALRRPGQVQELVEPHLGGDDPLFGSRCPLELAALYDPDALADLRPDTSGEVTVLYGCGAALAGWQGPLLYVDVPKNEVQFRARAGSVANLGMDVPLDPGPAYKRSYFVDWPVAGRHKESLLPRIDWMVDGQRPDDPTFLAGADLRRGLTEMAHGSFRTRAWFEPGPWGGQWIRERIPDLPREVPNYAWSFELIAPENGVILESDGLLVEVSFDLLMFQEGQAVLGESAAQFGTEFPIRYDFLDTVDGGNLSVQVHPRPEYVRSHFGERFTQDESYYILDCVPGARVNLGFQEDVDPQEFVAALRHSVQAGDPVDVERYVQSLPVARHDLFLIPHGTIHGSGAGSLVLEISATPYIFTFKMYDWLRLGLDGRPRTLNIERGAENVFWDRRGTRIPEEFVSHPEVVAEERDDSGYRRVVHLPTHDAHFYDVHRYEFDSSVAVPTAGSCHVLSLVEGRAVVLEAGQRRTTHHHAETFVVPAAAGAYRLTSPDGADLKVVATTVKPVDRWLPGTVADPGGRP